MPRNISFALTTEQFRNRTKTVTRRIGWKNLKVGDILCACVKCMGLKPGEKIERLGLIRVVSVRRESLTALWGTYGRAEAVKEGFPQLSGSRFADMFCQHMKCGPTTEVTRIEFEYLDPLTKTESKKMKAKPLKFVYADGYHPCSPEEATHVELHVPGPFPSRIIPVQIKGARAGTGNWSWNGDTEKPTLKPSILTKASFDGRQDKVCHSFVNDGCIQFLGDCTHDFAGQTLDLLEVE